MEQYNMNKKELKNILKLESKENKISFILSSRKDKKLKTNKEYYRYIFNEYKLMNIKEIDNEFCFYINQYNMRNEWKNYYTDLNIPKTWENISYSNDELPSFMYNNFQIWIDKPDSDKSQFPNRFCMMKLDDDKQTIDDWYFDTNNFDEVLNYVNNKTKEI